jgi:hypothetical protein
VKVRELARRGRHPTSPHNTAGKFCSKHLSLFHPTSSSTPASFFFIPILIILFGFSPPLSPRKFSPSSLLTNIPLLPLPPELTIMGLFARKRAVNGATNGHGHGPDRRTSHESPRSHRKEKFDIDSGYYNRRPSFGQWLK